MNNSAQPANPTALKNGDAITSAADSKLTGATAPVAPVPSTKYRLAGLAGMIYSDVKELAEYETLDLDLLTRIAQQTRLLNARVQELHNRALGFDIPRMSR